VDGETVTDPSLRVDPGWQRVLLDGKPLRPVEARTFAVHKPRGELAASAHPWSESAPGTRLRRPAGRLLPVGRLSAASEGLVLFTTDGDLAQTLARAPIPETYHVRVRGRPGEREMEKLRRGVVGEGTVRPEEVRLSGRGRNAWLLLRVRRGRDRDLREVLRILGHPVVKLRRVAFGPLTLSTARPGEWRELRPEEVVRLRSAARTALAGARDGLPPRPAGRKTGRRGRRT
jgi:23S rRNA pseudouridine2605 synthase